MRFSQHMSILCALVLLLLFFCFAPATANYGTENDELGVDDDSSVQADDDALKKVESEQEELKKKLEDMERLTSKMRSKAELLKRVKGLKKKLSVRIKEEHDEKEEGTRAVEMLHLAEQRKNATWDEKEHIAEQRKHIEKLLLDLQNEKSNFDTAFAKIDAERKKTDARERELEAERERLMKKVEGIVNRFQESGFHTWLEHNVDLLPPVMKETILKTSDALEPIVRGVDEAAELNEQLTNETTEAINQYLPAIKNSLFYSGLIFYIILLCPLVAATWLVMKIKKRLSMLTVEHYIIAINLYFGILSVACALMTLLSRADILIVFRHRSQRLAETFMLMHGLLFLFHLILHGMIAYVSGMRKDFVQYICMSCVGLHFFMNAYKRTILNQDPNIGAPAYIVYSGVFLYTLYDRGGYVIEAAVKDRKAGTTAFGTYPDQGLVSQAAGLGKESVDKPVYFAGLPIFSNAAQSSLNDAKTI